MAMAAHRVAATSLRCRSAGATHAGRRALNEDRLLRRPEAGLWAVADGMGGHQAGDVAADMVMGALRLIDDAPSGYHALAAVQRQLRSANAALVERAERAGAGVTMGATVVTLLIHDSYYACLWAGDSRAYLHRDGRLTRLTKDHTLVQALVDAGAMTPVEARTDFRANIVTRAVGAAPALALDIAHGAVEPGDLFLLCSDGLTAVVEDWEIDAIVGAGDVDVAVGTLLSLALERDAADNVTVVAVAAGPGD